MATNPRRPFAGTGRNPIPFTPDSLPDWLQVPYSGQEVLELVIDNAELLYPVAEHIATYVLSFDDLTKAERKSIAKKLLRPLQSKRRPPPPYYAMWILHIFASSPDWNHANEIMKLFNDSGSEVIKRSCALVIHRSGTRAQAVAVKDSYGSASHMLRLGIL